MSVQQKPGLMRRIKGFMMKHMHGMISCREFEDFILRYLDGELPARQTNLFEWHMRMCRECREYLAAYKQAIELGKAVLGPADEAVPADVPDDLIKAVLDSRKG